MVSLPQIQQIKDLMDLAPGETAGGSGGALCLLQMHSTQQSQPQGQKALQDVQGSAWGRSLQTAAGAAVHGDFCGWWE